MELVMSFIVEIHHIKGININKVKRVRMGQSLIWIIKLVKKKRLIALCHDTCIKKNGQDLWQESTPTKVLWRGFDIGLFFSNSEGSM